MITSVAKWGNSHAIRLSKEFMQQARLTTHDRLSITIADDTIMLKKLPRTKAEKFLEIYGGFDGDWKCQEVSTGAEIGKEAAE